MKNKFRSESTSPLHTAVKEPVTKPYYRKIFSLFTTENFSIFMRRKSVTGFTDYFGKPLYENTRLKFFVYF